VVSRAVHPEVNSFIELLTNMGASDSGLAIQPVTNFHHLPGRKLPPSVSNQTCSCEVYCAYHSNKREGNKAAISEAEVCPPVKAACLASLSAFWFP
jgi:hypothetical protein